jgi:hypothetical protein
MHPQDCLRSDSATAASSAVLASWAASTQAGETALQQQSLAQQQQQSSYLRSFRRSSRTRHEQKNVHWKK